MVYEVRLSLYKDGERVAFKNCPVHAEDISAGLYLLKVKTEEIKRDLLWQVSGENELMTCAECV